MNSIPQEILDYINTSLIQGFTEKQIQEALLQSGYQQSYISSVFAEYYRQTRPQSGAQSSLPLPNISQLFTETLRLYTQNFFRVLGGMLVLTFILIFLLILLLIVFGIVAFALSLVGVFTITSPAELLPFFTQNPVATIIIAGVLLLPFLIAYLYLNSWIQLSFLYIIGGINQKRGVKDSLKAAWPRTIKFYWTNLIFTSLFIIGLLFPIVNIVFLTWFRLFFFTFTEENLSGPQALLKSKAYVKNRFFSVLGRLVVIEFFGIASYFGIKILSETTSGSEGLIQIIIPLIILLVLVAVLPIYLIYHYVLYSHLRASTDIIATPPSPRSQLLLSITPFITAILVTIFIAAIVLVFSQITSPSLTENEQSEPPSTRVDLDTAKGRDIKRQADLEEIRGAVLYHKVFNPTYPNTLDEIELPNDGKIPRDPSTQQPYQYSLLDNGSQYEICANFETKERSCLTSPDRTPL